MSKEFFGPIQPFGLESMGLLNKLGKPNELSKAYDKNLQPLL